MRVAVVQLDFHPAVPDALEDPVFDIKRTRSSLLPTAGPPPDRLQKEFTSLGERIRKAYAGQLARRIEVVLDRCRRWNVQIVVFPEYSIPYDLLERVALHAPHLVVVAGTHLVDLEVLNSGIYKRLGLQREPFLGNAVSPVLHGGRLLGLIPKLHPSKHERTWLEPGKTWEPVPMPDGIEGPMAVLICLDFLERHPDFVTRPLQNCRFIAAPSLTDEHSVKEFRAHAEEDAKRKRFPVLYANHAPGGGTSVYVDEGPYAASDELHDFPRRAGSLAPGEEGVIVADIDLGYQRTGTSTTYELSRHIIPYAAASFVYRGFERTYADWIEQIEEALSHESPSESAAVREVLALLQRSLPPLPERHGSRRHRLESLRWKTAKPSGLRLEIIHQLTREIVLPDEVVPLPALRAAMARGAADVIQTWYTDPKTDSDIAAFAGVTAALRDAGDRAMRPLPSAGAEAQQAISDITNEVRGSPPKPSEQALVLQIERYDQALEPRLQEEKAAAGTLFEQGKHEAAREKYRALAMEAEGLFMDETVESPKMRRLATVCRLNEAACSINLGEFDWAREILPRIDWELLTLRGRLEMVQVLAAVGERERARGLLAELTADGAQSADIVAVRQGIDLDEGRIPEVLSPQAQVHAQAAFVYLGQNGLTAAAERAIFALEEATERTDLVAAHAIAILVEALRRTVVEDLPPGQGASPTVQLIPVEQREQIVLLLDRELPRIMAVELPPKLREHLRSLSGQFAALVHDDDALSLLGDIPSEMGGAVQLWKKACQLALEGKVDDALRVLPAEDHPWRGVLNRVEILRLGKAFERALAEALDLVERYPERAPIEYEAAWLLAGEGRLSEAVEHAEGAFRALPGLGQRCLYAEILMGLDRNEKAWDLLVPMSATDRPRALYLLALIADAVEPSRATEFWSKYVERRPDDALARVVLADRLHTFHRPADAARIAWNAFEKHGDRLPLDALHRCAILQRLPGPPEPRQQERMRQVMIRIRDRFPDNPEAERVRLLIRTAAGIEHPGPEERIDYKLLERSPYIYRGEGIDPLRDWIQQRHQVGAMVGQLARTGRLPIATACAFNTLPLAQFIRRILRAQRTTFAWFCPPIAITDQPPMASLEGQQFLISDLEILLLQVLGLVEPLRRALGETGRLLLFAYVLERIRHDAGRLNQEIRPARLKQQEDLLRRVRQLRAPPRGLGENLDDFALARKHRLPLVTEEAPADIERLSPRALVRYLEMDGSIEPEAATRIAQSLPTEPEPLASFPHPAPASFLVTAPLLSGLFEEGEGKAFQVFVDAFHEHVVVAPSVYASLEWERNNLEETLQASSLANEIHCWVGEGVSQWIRILANRKPAGLPPLRNPEDEVAQNLVRGPIEEVMAYREVLLEDPTAWRITADFFGSVATGDPELLRQLAWSSGDEYRAFVHRTRPATTRHIHLPALVRMLGGSEKQRDQRLRLLAELGFPDALGPGEILRVGHQFGGLGKKEPARLLERQEWIARMQGHVAGDLARLRLVQVYSETIFRAVVGEEAPGEPDRIARTMSLEEGEANARVLLERQENISAATSTNVLDQTLMGLASRAIDAFTLAFRQDEGSYTLADHNPLDNLWTLLDSWAGPDGPRRNAYARAIRHVWSMLDRWRRTSPDPIRVAMLFHSRRLTPGRRGLFDLTEPEGEPLFILSSCWPEYQLPDFQIDVKKADLPEPVTLHLSFDDLLNHGVKVLETGAREFMGHSRTMFYTFPLSVQGETLNLAVPFEAVLLRMTPDHCKGMAGELKVVQGRHDGRAYRLLSVLEKKPASACVRRAVARHASTALWRLVRDDPAFLHVWPGKLGIPEQRPTVNDLRDLLSEPRGAFPIETTPLDFLRQRFEQGAWSTRDDQGHLLAMATEIPGPLPVLTVWSRLHNESNYPAHVRDALWELDHADEIPAARIASAILFLRVAAARKPIVALPEGTVNLHEILPERFERVLARVIDTPQPDTVAAHEPALLQVCAAVVQRLAYPAVLALREGLWLTWRLFQWLCLQLQAIDPDARRDGMKRLAALAPTSLPDPVDRLDPFGFGRNRFDHRLAAVLHAFDVMQGMWKGLVEREPTSPVHLRDLHNVSSKGLEEKLRMLAERHPEGPDLGSQLDWNAPGNLPDLALLALLHLSLSAFGELHAEARKRSFQALPLEPDPPDPAAVDPHANSLSDAVIHAVSVTAHQLDPDERAVLIDRLRAMKDGPTSRRWRWIAFTGLFAAGEADLEPEVSTLLVEHSTEPTASSFAGMYLLTIAALAPDRLGTVADSLIHALISRGADAVLVALALGQVYVHAQPPGQDLAREKLAALAQHAPFSEDPHMQELVGFLGLKGEGEHA